MAGIGSKEENLFFLLFCVLSSDFMPMVFGILRPMAISEKSKAERSRCLFYVSYKPRGYIASYTGHDGNVYASDERLLRPLVMIEVRLRRSMANLMCVKQPSLLTVAYCNDIGISCVIPVLIWSYARVLIL